LGPLETPVTGPGSLRVGWMAAGQRKVSDELVGLVPIHVPEGGGRLGPGLIGIGPRSNERIWSEESLKAQDGLGGRIGAAQKAVGVRQGG